MKILPFKWLALCFSLALIIGAFSQFQLTHSPASQTTPTSALQPQGVELSSERQDFPLYQRYDRERSHLHIVHIPNNGEWQIIPSVADYLMSLTEFKATEVGADAIAIINAGFFDPVNQQTTSYITITGELVADPRNNTRLMDNPDLIPYMDQILNRSEFRHYICGNESQYAIANHTEPTPSGCRLEHAIGAGPRLLPTLELESEGFRAEVAGEIIRDAIGSDRPNARSAIGITADGTIILAMAAQIPNQPASGMTLPELNEALAELGIIEALNLDGGSSSGLFVQGRVYYGRFDEAERPIERSLKSVWLVRRSSQP
jgi:hypothetical protein